jgi:hypothetical protein
MLTSPALFHYPPNHHHNGPHNPLPPRHPPHPPKAHPAPSPENLSTNLAPYPPRTNPRHALPTCQRPPHSPPTSNPANTNLRLARPITRPRAPLLSLLPQQHIRDSPPADPQHARTRLSHALNSTANTSTTTPRLSAIQPRVAHALAAPPDELLLLITQRHSRSAWVRQAEPL